MSASDVGGQTGYVYVAAAYNDGLVKIGFTYQNPRRRMQQLSTGLPGSFQLLHIVETDAPKLLEQQLHRRFAARRYDKSREFFRVTVDEVKKAVREISEELRYREDLAIAQKRLDDATIWWFHGHVASQPDFMRAVIALVRCIPAFVIAYVINIWAIDGLSVAALASHFQDPKPVYLFFPIGWLTGGGVALILCLFTLVHLDRPRNRRQLEAMRDVLAKSMRLRPSDLKVGNHEAQLMWPWK